jgi:hypothetical protein
VAAVDESRQKTRLPRLGLAPVVVAGKPSSFARPADAFRVGVAAPVGVAFRRSQDVLRHRVQVPAAEGTAIGGGPPALGAPERPPPRVVEIGHVASGHALEEAAQSLEDQVVFPEASTLVIDRLILGS